MDRFILNYNGNKYRETKKYLTEEIINYDFDYIAEPFGGIFGFSRYYYLLKKDNKKLKLLINDIDTDLYLFYNSLKKDFNKTLDNIENEFNKIIKDENITEDHQLTIFLKKKESYIYNIIKLIGLSVCNCFSISKFRTKLKNFKNKETEYKNLFKKCTFYNMTSLQFVDKIKHKKKLLIYFDPPYFNSHNLNYHNEFKNKDYHDGTSIYIEILNIMKDKNINSIFVLNKIDIINYLFKDFFLKEYTGTYQNNGKNKKWHIIYNNF